MGHVPSGPFPVERQGSDVSRREHRRSRPAGNPALNGRIPLGILGESIACRFLTDHGIVVVDRNVRVGRGELDILALDGRERLVVEVRTSSQSRYPFDSIDDRKREQVGKLARRIGIRRIDGVGVGIFTGFVIVHWDRYSF